jgi:hypothetical protein
MKYTIPCFPDFRVSTEKSAIILVGLPLFDLATLSLLQLSIFFPFSVT